MLAQPHYGRFDRMAKRQETRTAVSGTSGRTLRAARAQVIGLYARICPVGALASDVCRGAGLVRAKERMVPKNKVVPIEEAMSHVESGMSIAVGGFIGQGDPLTLIDYLKTMDVADLTIYENDGGYRDRGTVELALQGKIKKIVASHVGTTPDYARLMNEGKIEVEATPQGTLAEMLRCGGAGLGGFLTPTGVGTIAEEGKQIVELDGRTYILVPAVKCDIAIVRAHAGDTWGNLIFRGTSRNFNVPAAMNARFTIAEVENLYTLGELDPNAIHTSGIFVNAVVRSNVEYCTLREEKLDA